MIFEHKVFHNYNKLSFYLDTGRNEIENIENVEQNSVNEPEALAGPKIKRS